MLAATVDCNASVVLRSRQRLRSIVEHAPAGFATQPAGYRYDVLLLKAWPGRRDEGRAPRLAWTKRMRGPGPSISLG